MVYELFTVGAPFEHFDSHPNNPNVPPPQNAVTYISEVTIPPGSGGGGSAGGVAGVAGGVTGVMATTQNMPPGSGGFGTGVGTGAGTGVGGGGMATSESGVGNEMLNMVMLMLDDGIPNNAQKEQCMAKLQEAVETGPPDFLMNFMTKFPNPAELQSFLEQSSVNTMLGPCVSVLVEASRNLKEKTNVTTAVPIDPMPTETFHNYEGFANHADSEDYDAEDAEDGEDGEGEDGADPEQNIVEDEDEESSSNNNSDGGIFDFFSKEKFTNQEEESDFFTTGNNNVLKMDLLLRSVLYACLFYLLAHPETLASVSKNIPGVKKANSLLVMMGVFFLVYYILNLFI